MESQSRPQNQGVFRTLHLITAALVSLLSDRVADSDWTYTLDKCGWWGDANNQQPIGSRLWQLASLPSSNTETYLAMAEGYATESLAWMVNDGVCKDVTCTASFTDSKSQELYLNVTFTKPDNSILTYAYVWS
ncbi:phage GP46 family protein [Gluconobacter cerinus]|uniref:phage GP46 family protein n=1 Tax=Gluconobacter cerinus TaxID=38307 RepID=UPI001B8C2F2F|nr:phage GP46 family protein [Gluconobacter cerinus]MBS1023503.1 phage GP46 family protein [Gluconobacter cerinus]